MPEASTQNVERDRQLPQPKATVVNGPRRGWSTGRLQPVVPAQRGVLGVHLGGAEVGRVVEQQVVEQVQTLLSATVTNQLTCYDGLEDSESSIASVLSEPLNNVTQLYSVSLGLVTQALDRNLK